MVDQPLMEALELFGVVGYFWHQWAVCHKLCHLTSTSFRFRCRMWLVWKTSRARTGLLKVTFYDSCAQNKF